MKVEGTGKRVTVLIGEGDRYEGAPAYEVIVAMLRRRGCAGATVLRGVMGFGATSAIHRAGFLDLSSDLPMMIVFADTAERVESVLPLLDDVIQSGTVLVEDCEILTYRPDEPPAR